MKECRDLGTEIEPIQIECPACSGAGCKECQDGLIQIDGCPNRYCSGVVTAIELFDLFEKGLPPVAGGVLDQSVWFIDASRYFEGEERRIKNGD